MQRCASTHQSQGKREETHLVHDKWVEQSKKVKSVATRSGPEAVRTLRLAVKWSKGGKWGGGLLVLGEGNSRNNWEISGKNKKNQDILGKSLKNP